jgi:hypothetical protein
MFIPDPSFFNPGSELYHPQSRIRIKEIKYFNPKKLFLISRKYRMIRVAHPIGIWMPDPDPDFLPIPDPEVKKAPDPRPGYATLPKAHK